MLKKMLVLTAVMLVLPGLILFSADNGDKHLKVKKGAVQFTVKGYSRNMKDADTTPLDQLGKPRKMRPVLNFESPRKLKQVSPNTDPVVQSGVNLGSSREALAMSAPIMNFAGMTLTANGAGWPPDTCGDVGINHYVQAVNTSIGIYNKSTGAKISSTTFDAFFAGSAVQGTPCDEDNNGDPIVLYDRYNQRWVILDFAWTGTTNGSWFSIAASKTSDPTGEWWLYALHADNTLMNDYPKAGVWNDGIYITANMFQFGGSFQGVKVWALKLPDLYNGTMTVQSVYDTSWQAWSIMPANSKGAVAPSAGTPCYMYAQDADEFGSPSIDAIYVWKYAVDWNNPGNTTWTGPSTMATAAYTLSSSKVPQPKTPLLDSLYGRLMNSAFYRKTASSESVALCHVCDSSSTRQMRWYEIRINSGVSSIYQQGTFVPNTTAHRWMGSVASDGNGGIAMGYSVSSKTVYPGIRYAGRKSTDPLGQLSQGEVTMQNGVGYQKTYSRWGDYSNLTIDPVDDLTFWYTTEWYPVTGTNWNTRVGSFKIN